MWINETTMDVYNYVHEIRQANPEVSLPASPTDSDFEQLGVFAVTKIPLPIYDDVAQGCRELDPLKDSAGVWVQRFEVYDLDPEQAAANLAAKNEQIQKSIVDQTQARLDGFAKTRNYDGILSLATYATSTNPKFQAEGQYGVEARDTTWSKLYEIMAEVESGTRQMPSGFADVEPELPVLEWPLA